MESKLIQAFHGSGESKTWAGDKKVDLPVTMEEAVQLWGEAKTIKMARESYTIDIQRELRAGGKVNAKSQLNQLIASAKQQKADGDSTSYDILVAANVSMS